MTKNMSVTLHISGSIHHRIVIFDTHMQNDGISRCFFNFFKILIFQVFRGLKDKKWPLNDKKFCQSHSKSQETYLISLWFLMQMCKMNDISSNFFHFFKILILGGFRGDKRAENDPKLPIPVCHTLYCKNCRSYHQDFWYTDVK